MSQVRSQVEVERKRRTLVHLYKHRHDADLSRPHLLFRKNMKKLSIGLHFGDYPLMGLGVHFRVIARKAN